MSVLWSSSSLKKLVNARSSKEWEASGVEIDSRKVKRGDLFCALNGENFNQLYYHQIFFHYVLQDGQRAHCAWDMSR